MQKNVEINQEIGRTRSIADVLSLTSREGNALNLVNCVTSLQRIAKLSTGGRQDAAAVAHITARATECFGGEQAQPRHVSGALWACAKLQLVPDPLLKAVVSAGALMQPSWFKPQEVSMAVWAIGKLHSAGMSTACGDAAAAFVGKLLPSALARPQDFDPQGLANLVSGVAAVGTAGRAGVEGRLAGALKGRLKELNAQEP